MIILHFQMRRRDARDVNARAFHCGRSHSYPVAIRRLPFWELIRHVTTYIQIYNMWGFIAFWAGYDSSSYSCHWWFFWFCHSAIRRSGCSSMYSFYMLYRSSSCVGGEIIVELRAHLSIGSFRVRFHARRHSTAIHHHLLLRVCCIINVYL